MRRMASGCTSPVQSAFEWSATDVARTLVIGIEGRIAPPPLPHHRTYGSVYGGSNQFSLARAANEGSPSEASSAFGSATDIAVVRLRCHGPRLLPAMFFAVSGLTPRFTSSA